MSDEGEKLTPMLEQYMSVKNRYKEHILFYRLGDFYEMFYDEAVSVSKELELTLTSRAGVPMCGVPYHAAEVYIKRLVENGHKVAICEQMTPPGEGKMITREVIRVVTPGTLIEDSMLDEGSNNFIACFFAEEKQCGMVFADLSTGELHAFNKSGKSFEDEIIGEMSRYTPVELLFNTDFLSYKNVGAFVKSRLIKSVGEVRDDSEFSETNAAIIGEQLKNKSLLELGIAEYPLITKALIAILRYFKETQKNGATRFIGLNVHTGDEFMGLNLTTRRNLELTETMRNKEKRGSLMWVLDKTSTSMGRRKLRQFIERPLVNTAEIISRHEAVEQLTSDVVALGDITEELRGIYDLERLMTRLVYKAASPRDVFALGKTCGRIPSLKEKLSAFSSPLIARLNSKIADLSEIAALVENALVDEPPALTKDGGYIRGGFNEELDRLREITHGGKNVLDEIEAREKEATGIKNLRVGYNRVFGYFIEVSKGNIGLVPENYIRKQTLTNGERYITEELKKIESEILGANDKIIALELEIFEEIRSFIVKKLEIIQATAEAISVVDVLTSFASVAIDNNYCRPAITLESVIEIKDGRHPVVEKMRTDMPFTPNDTYLDLNENRLIIITGPNMSGKSTFMRQVAVITLMAQIGSFVPARYARIGVVDKIFTRVGASDDLTAGQSTFMVEMNEVAEILKSATSRSLVILDEIGRGTSTFDGISIAKAVAEYINGKAIGCKTLFATHYHELIALEKHNKGIRNFSVSAIKHGDELKFLHKVAEGGTDDSYGIEVAKLAGLPNKVIAAAKTALVQMEQGSKIQLEQELREEEENRPQVDFSAIAKENAVARIKALDVNLLTPLDALTVLSEIKKSLN